MVEIIKNKKVIYNRKNANAELCVQTVWKAKGERFRTTFGVFSGLHTSDKKCVDGYKKQGVKFSEKKSYFVRIMDENGKCVIAFKPKQKLPTAENQFKNLRK